MRGIFCIRVNEPAGIFELIISYKNKIKETIVSRGQFIFLGSGVVTIGVSYYEWVSKKMNAFVLICSLME